MPHLLPPFYRSSDPPSPGPPLIPHFYPLTLLTPLPLPSFPSSPLPPAMTDFSLNTFDATAISDMDPSIADGYRVIYDREVPFELRLQEVSMEEMVKVVEMEERAKTTAHTQSQPRRRLSIDGELWN